MRMRSHSAGSRRSGTIETSTSPIMLSFTLILYLQLSSEFSGNLLLTSGWIRVHLMDCFL